MGKFTEPASRRERLLGGSGELTFKGYSASVWDDEALQMGSGDGYTFWFY